MLATVLPSRKLLCRTLQSLQDFQVAYCQTVTDMLWLLLVGDDQKQTLYTPIQRMPGEFNVRIISSAAAKKIKDLPANY